MLVNAASVDGSIPIAERPQLILSAEAELGITAGLQDRVIQVGYIPHLPPSPPLPSPPNMVSGTEMNSY